MKSLPFTIPNSGDQSFLIQVDNFEHFYPYLHRHPEIQITQINKGKGFLLADNEVFAFEEGDIFVIASNVSHVFKDDYSSKGVASVSIFFRHEITQNTLLAVPELSEVASFYARINNCQKIKEPIRSETKVVIQKLTDYKGEIDNLLLFQKLLLAFFNKLEINTTEKLTYSEKDGDTMKLIIDYTLNNFHSDIIIGDISTKIGYTPEAFCRFFKKRTGKTYITYLNEIRVNKASQLLINSKIPIGEIAYESGFNNVTHFNRVFKQIKKTNPGSYRKLVK